MIWPQERSCLWGGVRAEGSGFSSQDSSHYRHNDGQDTKGLSVAVPLADEASSLRHAIRAFVTICMRGFTDYSHRQHANASGTTRSYTGADRVYKNKVPARCRHQVAVRARSHRPRESPAATIQTPLALLQAVCSRDR